MIIRPPAPVPVKRPAAATADARRYRTVLLPSGQVTYRNLSRYAAETYVEHYNELWGPQGLRAVVQPETATSETSEAEL
jgi:hypothetical protein